MVKKFNTAEYEFAIRETKTKDIIEDVSTGKSEIGIIYLSNFNRMAITKLLHTKDLEFHELTACEVYVYLWKGHPLAECKSIRFEQLNEYPCLSFEQGDNSSFYFAEEILSTNEYARTIKANDRATMLNLMIGLNGYTLCSGIICEKLNGSDYIAVPFEHEDTETADRMVIGYRAGGTDGASDACGLPCKRRVSLCRVFEAENQQGYAEGENDDGRGVSGSESAKPKATWTF